MPQTGNVVIEDNCDIGALTTIDRATLGSTVIRKGCKLDNLIQIAHNVVVGEGTVIAAQTGIAGSTTIGTKHDWRTGWHRWAPHLGGWHQDRGQVRRIRQPASRGRNVPGIPAVPVKQFQAFTLRCADSPASP